MKIAFLRPNLQANRSSDAMRPLVFAILRAVTPDDVETVLYDERIEEMPVDESVDLAAITVETFNARRAYEIAAEYRGRGIPVVMGGFHPTLAPDEAQQHADAIVRGDAERIWPTVIEDARQGRLAHVYRDAEPPDLAGLRVDHSLFDEKPYGPVALVQFGRGCRFNCEFCAIRGFYGANLRQRPVREVVAEIEAFDEPYLFLVDDNVFADREAARELLQGLVPLGIQWAGQISIDVAEDRELVDLLRRSGCVVATVGFESLERENLRQMNKAWNMRPGGYGDAIRVLQDAGIMIYGTFVFGYDRDTRAIIDAAVELAIDHRFYLANFNPLTPMPGTPLFDRLVREGRLRYERWWIDPDYRYGEAAFHPRSMTADELTEGCFRARRDFNRYSSIAKRLLDRRTNLGSARRLGLFLRSNLISRREIFRKQGRPLGSGSLPRTTGAPA